MGKIVGVGHGPRISPLPEVAGGGPNEPAGFDPWFHHDFSVIPENETDYVACSDLGFMKIQRNAGNHAVVAETDAPHGRGHSLRRAFPEGMEDGKTGGTWHTKNVEGGFGDQPQLKEWYMSYWLKFEGPTWEAPPGDVQKVWYNRTGDLSTVGESQNLRMFRDSNGDPVGQGGPVEQFMRWAVRYKDGTGSNNETRVPVLIEVGKWYHVEYHGKKAALDAFDGFRRLYVDGDFKGGWEDINDHSASISDGFAGVHFAPVWGGSCSPSGSCPKLEDDFMRIGDFYVSGIPL